MPVTGLRTAVDVEAARSTSQGVDGTFSRNFEVFTHSHQLGISHIFRLPSSIIHLPSSVIQCRYRPAIPSPLTPRDHCASDPHAAPSPSSTRPALHRLWRLPTSSRHSVSLSRSYSWTPPTGVQLRVTGLMMEAEPARQLPQRETLSDTPSQTGHCAPTSDLCALFPGSGAGLHSSKYARTPTLGGLRRQAPRLHLEGATNLRDLQASGCPPSPHSAPPSARSRHLAPPSPSDSVTASALPLGPPWNAQPLSDRCHPTCPSGSSLPCS